MLKIFEEIVQLVNEYGWSTVIIVGVVAPTIYYRKSIATWIWTTIQAAAIVKAHEATIEQLRMEVQQLNDKVEKYNKTLIEQAETIGRLEGRIVEMASKKSRKKSET